MQRLFVVLTAFVIAAPTGRAQMVAPTGASGQQTALRVAGAKTAPRPADLADIDWSKPVGIAEPARLQAPAPERQPAKLGPIDAWRYRRCQENAAQAPTAVGVHTSMRLCREQFDQ